MSQGNLSRHRVSAAANKGDLTDCMMRSLEGTFGDKTCASFQSAGNRVDLGRLETFGERERWENRGQPLGQHTLSGSRRADHNQVMATCGRNLESAFHTLLAANVGEVRVIFILMSIEFSSGIYHRGLQLIGGVGSVQEIDYLMQVPCAIDIQAVHNSRLVYVLNGKNQSVVAQLAGFDGNGQSAANRLQGTIETQLCNNHIPAERVMRHHPIGSQHAQGYWQVKARALLANVGWSEIYGDALVGNLYPRVLYCSVDAAVAFAHAAVRQPDNCHAINSFRHRWNCVNLYDDRNRIDAIHRRTVEFR